MKPKIIKATKKVGYLSAVIIIALAVLVVVGRAVTPYMDARRDDIEKWAGELIHAPIKIESARISWFQYQPGVALSHVSLLDNQTGKPVLQAKVIKVFFSIPQSLWQWKLIPSGIVISGTDLIVRQDAQGEFTIQGFPTLGGYDQKPFDSESKMRDVAAWLATGPLIILRDIDVRFTGLTGQKRYVTLYNLRLSNSMNEHNVDGEAILHQELATEVQLSMRWRGDFLQPKTLSGRAYLDVTGLSLGQWFNDINWHGFVIKKGILSGKGWVDVQQGEIDKVQSTFEFFNLEIFSAANKSTHHYQRVSGDLGWKKSGSNYIIAGDDILIDDDQRLWPVSNFYVQLSPDDKGELLPTLIRLGYVDIAEGRDLLAALPYQLPDGLLKTLNEFDVKGGLENLVFNLAVNNHALTLLSAEGSINNIGVKSARGLPAFKNLSAKIKWANQIVNVSLNSKKFELNAKEIFDAPIVLSQLIGDIRYQQTADHQHVMTLTKLNGLNNDIIFNLDGKLMLDEKGSPIADIVGNLALQHAPHITHYLPTKIFSKDLSDWLRHAFLAGSAESGTIILRGKLADFPYENNNGLFEIKTQVKNVQLHYAPGWPDLTNIDGLLQFTGRKILIDLQHARILNVNLGQTHGEIPYLGDAKPAVLTVMSTPIHTDFTSGVEFLHQSPLEKTIGKMFTNVKLMGPIDLVLSLSVPLSDTDKTTVNGTITAQDATMRLVPWQLDILHLNGVIGFSESSTNANALQAQLFGKPLRLDLATIKNKGQGFVRATVYSAIDLKDIENWLHLSFNDVASGTANISAEIDLAVDQPISVKLQSTLQGVTLHLPEQFSKTADQQRDVTATMTVSEGEPLKVKVNYANAVNLAALMDRVKQRFTITALTLNLGAGNAEWPAGKGLYVTGTLPIVTEDKLKPFLTAGVSQDVLPLKEIDVNVKDVNLYGVHLTNARVQLKPAMSSWDIKIDSPEIAGHIILPKELTKSSTIIADLDKVDIDSLANKKTESIATTANTLPSIKFSSDLIIYDGIRIGAVSFASIPTQHGLAIQKLSIDSPDISLWASGAWLQQDKSNVTRLHGKGQSGNVSKLLKSLGFDVHNFEASNGTLNFDLSWSNPPFALSMANLSGNANLAIGKGRIVEVSQGTDAKMDLGRMLNLFSLQSIPRRLSLDFSDVFQKGYSFDSLRGDFTFNSGNAQTNNMRFDGPLARVEIRGRIGVNKKDFDLTLSVTPYVTASIPVAATLLTGQPVIGVAAWAVNKMIGSEVSKAVTYYYAVTGSWADPSWKEIRKAQAKQ